MTPTSSFRASWLLMLAGVAFASSCAKPAPPAAAPVAAKTVQPASPPAVAPPDAAPANTEPPVASKVLISAAASTKEIMETLAAQFMAAQGGEVQVNAAGSSTLANQIISGAPAELFLSASQQWADEVEKKDLSLRSVRLLTNKLVIVVPKGNPGEVKTPQDLLSSKVKKIALAGEKVPAGMYADQALKKLGLSEQLDVDLKIARGQDVRAALSYVERGEAEAGIVYSTDVAAAKNVEQVYEFEPQLHDEIVYVLQLLKMGESNPLAAKFFDYLQSAEADEVYKARGFQRATAAVVPELAPAPAAAAAVLP